MVDSSSDTAEKKMESKQGVIQWAIRGAIIGAIPALIQILLLFTFGGILFDNTQGSQVYRALLLFFSVIILFACLGGIMGGFISSRFGTKKWEFGATVGGLIIGFSPLLAILLFDLYYSFQ